MRRSVSHRLERMAKRLTTGSALPRSSPRKGPHTRPILIEKNEARRVLIREDRKIPPSHTGHSQDRGESTLSIHSLGLPTTAVHGGRGVRVIEALSWRT